MSSFSITHLLAKLVLLALVSALSTNRSDGASAVVTTDFEQGLGPWQALSEGLWELQDIDGNTVAALVETGVDRPPVRRPQAYILLTQHAFLDFTITARVQSLEPNTQLGRDVVVIFGYIDDTHYYYAHLANSNIGTYHNIIVKVSGDTRAIIQNKAKPEARLFDGWQAVKVTRDTEGNIAVFMGDFGTPIMTATEIDYPLGTIGFGSFDGRALFDDIHVEGTPPDSLTIERPTTQSVTSVHYTVYEGIPVTIESSADFSNWSPLFEPVTTLFTSVQSYALPTPINTPTFFRVDYVYPAPL